MRAGSVQRRRMPSSAQTTRGRILVADDQPAIRDAPAAQRRGICARAGVVAGGSAGGGAGRGIGTGIHRPQLHARHHQRPGGIGPVGSPAGAGKCPAGRGDDRLGHGGPGGRSNAPGGQGFHPETVGKPACPSDAPHAVGTERYPAQQRASGSREPCSARRRGRPGRGVRGPQRGHVARAGNHRERRSIGRARAHHRRERHGQGVGRPRAARRQPARRETAGQRQHGRPERKRVRERIVRPRARGVHGRQDGPYRTLRVGRRGHAVFGRNRQRAATAASQASAPVGNR